MDQAPTGTITLVFTDIQGSTVLWEHFGDKFKPLLDRHNDLFRASIAEFKGYEVQTVGDAFMVAFQDPNAAVAMCLAVQEQLHTAEWPDELNHRDLANFAGSSEDGHFRGIRVRMGVHTGTPTAQPDPVSGRMNYFGSMVNCAARVCDVGHGGQVVVSEATWEAVGNDGLPEGTAIKDLGEHALKGLERREHLRELLPGSLSGRTFPRLKTPNLKKTNLPTRLDSFFGREQELSELSRRIAGGQRLITVLGAGGTGKTRLVLRLGATQLSSFSGGVWFCDLTEARTRPGILSAVGAALEVRLLDQDPEAQLANTILGRGRVLVILDNFEQVANQAMDTVGRWVQRAPEAVFLVTSRALLRISGEEVFLLAPLPAVEAVSLFYDRARAVQPGFGRTDDNEPVVTEIVERLDCMSLAVELAAARVRLLSPEKIQERLSQRFKLLRGQRRDQSARQATLRGAIDWSWELLKPVEQSALSQLSVFHGGCTLEAAEAVVDLESFEEAPWVMDVVEALVDHSLLRRVEPIPGQVRYRMLESIRQYAAEKLGEETAPTMLRHGSHFASFGKEVYIESLDTHGGVERRKTLALEFENFLAGVDAGLAAGELEVAAGCALAGAELFRINGPFSDGIALLERFSEQPIDLGTKARFFHMGGWFLQLAGRPVESLEHWDQALAIHKELGSLRNEGKTLAHQAVFCFEQGRIPEALEHFSRALAIHQEVGDRRFEAISLGGLAAILSNEGRNSEALEHYCQMLAITRAVGDRRMEGLTLGNLAAFYHDQGRVPESLEHYDMALEMARSVGDRRMEGLSLGNLGRLLFTQGDLPSAEAHLRDAILISDEIWPTAAGAFRGALALIRAQQGAWEEARSLLAQGESQVRGVYATELGKLLSKKARVEHLAGDSAAAATALAEAESIAVKLGAGPDGDLSQALAEARAVMAR